MVYIQIKSKKSPTISKENKTEHRWERRAKLLSKKGYTIGNIHAMMDSGSGNFPAKILEKMIKNKVNPEEMNMDDTHL